MQFVQFQTLLNCITSDFLQHGYSPYGPPPPFPHPTTPGDPSIPRTENSQVNLSFAFKSESRILNMTQSLLCYGVLRVTRHPHVMERMPCSRWTFHVVVTGFGRLLAANRSRLLATYPTAGSGLLAIADATAGPPGWQVSPPFGMPLWTTLHQPTSSSPTIRQAYANLIQI
jgi:hypothetical protein